MTDIRVWVDGVLVDPDAPAVSAVDHGVTVGDGAFETAKIDGGVPFAVTRHLRRLDRTMAGLGLPPADHDRIREGVDAVLAGEPVEFGRLRVTVTGGRGPLGSDRHDSDLTHIVTAVPHARPDAHGPVVTVPWVRNERAATAGLKTTSYAENVIALAAAQAARGRRGAVRQHPRRAVRGHGQQRLRRRRRRREHPAAVERLPRRDHPRARHGVVRARGARGRRGDPAPRRADPRRRGVPHLLDQGRLPGVRRRRPRAARPRGRSPGTSPTCGPAMPRRAWTRDPADPGRPAHPPAARRRRRP